MRTVKLLRVMPSNEQTLGVWVAGSEREIFVCRTLELSWKNNDNNISCIPVGEYVCQWSKSQRLTEVKGEDVYTYEVLGVPDRAGIRIHSANYFTQIKGCIALGDAHKDINIDGALDVTHSGKTVDDFAKFMNYETFKLVIEA